MAPTFLERDRPMTTFRRSAEAETFDAALRGVVPASDPQVADLLHTVATLQARTVDEPRPEFLGDLRSRLMAEAADVLEVRDPAPVASSGTSRGVRRRLAGVVAAAVTVAGGAGLVASSASALPGEVLYPVKRGTEQVQKSLRLSDSARGAFELEQASRRLSEVEALTERGDARTDVVEKALTEFESVARSGTGRLLEAYADDQDESKVQQVDQFVASTAPTLEKLDRSVGDADAEVVDRVKGLVDELAGTVETTCPTCLSTESRRLADKVQRSVGGDSPRSSGRIERSVPRADRTTAAPVAKSPAAEKKRRGQSVSIPTTTVPQTGTARDSGRADSRAPARPSATPARPSRDSAQQRAEQRSAERDARAEERRAEREAREAERRAERERREREREARAEERRREREERREAREERRREREEQLRRWIPLR